MPAVTRRRLGRKVVRVGSATNHGAYQRSTNRTRRLLVRCAQNEGQNIHRDGEQRKECCHANFTGVAAPPFVKVLPKIVNQKRVPSETAAIAKTTTFRKVKAKSSATSMFEGSRIREREEKHFAQRLRGLRSCGQATGKKKTETCGCHKVFQEIPRSPPQHPRAQRCNYCRVALSPTINSATPHSFVPRRMRT